MTMNNILSWNNHIDLIMKKLSKAYYKGCGRKNTPIWEGHSFGWGARRRTAAYVPFSVYTMAWLGEHRACIVEELIKNGGFPGYVICLCGDIGWPLRSPDLTPCDFFSVGLPQSKGLRTTPRNFGSSEGGDTTGSCCHYT